MSAGEQLAQRLARRIQWLERARRPLAVTVALSLTALGLWALPSDWPGGHTVMMLVVIPPALWYGVEMALGFVIALWETDLAQLSRSAGLPRAVLRRRKPTPR